MTGQNKGSTKQFNWVGYCLECERWRHSLHVISNIRTHQKRCGICGAVILIVCPVCNGDGSLYVEGHNKQNCPHCAGQKVVAQQKVGAKE